MINPYRLAQDMLNAIPEISSPWTSTTVAKIVVVESGDDMIVFETFARIDAGEPLTGEQGVLGRMRSRPSASDTTVRARWHGLTFRMVGSSPVMRT